MKIVHFLYQSRDLYGVLLDDRIQVLDGDLYAGHGLAGMQTTEEWIDGRSVKLLAPISCPRQIIGIGLNYSAHIAEFHGHQRVELPDFPVAFMLAQSALTDPEAHIRLPYPKHRVDFEAELVVVIGKETFQISEAEAADHILGYTCGNDISDRDIQKEDKQWTRANSFPGYKPTGPWIETELDVTRLELKTLINGRLQQSGNTSQMIFQVPQLIADLSRFMRLYPGDLIFTGTPEGVGQLRPGDCCEIAIEGIGVLRNLIDKAARD